MEPMKPYTFKIPDDLIKKLKARAKQKASTVSQEIRNAIIQYLNKDQ